MVNVVGFICGPKIYKFGKWTFEYSYTGGPWPLKKDGDLRKRCGMKFYKDLEDFFKLSDEERKQYRIGGGCIPFSC